MKHLNIYIMLLGFSIFTGATFNLAKYTVGYFSPSSSAAWRFGLAAAVMLIILIFTEGIKKSQLRKNAVSYIVLGIIGIFGFNALFFVGLKYTSPVNGALIMGLNPLLTAILARIILKDNMTKKQVLGIFFAFIGVLLVITQGSIETIKTLSISGGDLIIFTGNVCWALYGVLGRRFVKDGTPLSTTTYTMVIGAVSLIVVSLFTSKPVSLSNIPIGVWGAIAFMAFFTSVLGYLWWNQGIKEIGASKTSLFFNLVPVVTMIISFAIGTPIKVFQVIGAVLVILGVLTASGVIRIPKYNTKEQSAI
ncbi:MULTISPECIES: DMT family transporter [Bacillus]|uniref:DMT family transporter n=1 Tax=Bacillus TaxID=1386 RepID=UPI0004A26104|nr:EamA family transporter [Bacillus subtilis]MBL3638788.1 EamA family transporter [Alkalicoccobacillus gibsonii]MDP4124437.1 EamA family transporter [Bacillota bacterium]KFC30202.1 transporter [Bacillus subtilis]MBU8844018.1 EamA family transporter [Alkalicoccobacillus gibsonii]MDI6583587.1 EamA family transporter [Bacillus subtilis]